ncbi:hypothetical protein J604_0360 [Acinetobacter sp. 694762]|nr:hypothetical protein J514_3526 [Acinetobacter sp. 1396970]EXI13791.1 hypothetical protein J604_0360 [Acinetobacter sp. 694762]
MNTQHLCKEHLISIKDIKTKGCYSKYFKNSSRTGKWTKLS